MGEDMFNLSNGMISINGKDFFKFSGFHEFKPDEDIVTEDISNEKAIELMPMEFSCSFKCDSVNRFMKNLDRVLIYGWKARGPIRKKLYEKLRKKQLKWYIKKAIIDEVCKYA